MEDFKNGLQYFPGKSPVSKNVKIPSMEITPPPDISLMSGGGDLHRRNFETGFFLRKNQKKVECTGVDAKGFFSQSSQSNQTSKGASRRSIGLTK